MNTPRLRTDLEIFPTLYGGEQVFVAKDVLGLIKQPILLRANDLRFLQLLDGTRTVHDIQLIFMRQQGGLLVSSDSIQKRLDQYDALFLLESELCAQARKEISENFLRLDIRPAFLAGTSYPADKTELKTYLDSFFTERSQKTVHKEMDSLRALIAPHIDLDIGKEIYASGYRTLQGLSPKKIFLFGTGHNLYGNLMSLTEKDFQTPLGLAKTDRSLVRKLKRQAESVCDPDDFAHRGEHSLEFQVLFLQLLFGDTIEIIPILFGSFAQVLVKYSRPNRIPGLDAFLETLRTTLAELKSDALCIAGVDLSHIGPKFGHEESAFALIGKAREHDQRLIETICMGDCEAFWEETQRVNGFYNVCGFSALACLLEVLPQSQGHLFGYDFWEEDTTRSAVSFAAIGIGD